MVTSSDTIREHLPATHFVHCSLSSQQSEYSPFPETAGKTGETAHRWPMEPIGTEHYCPREIQYFPSEARKILIIKSFNLWKGLIATGYLPRVWGFPANGFETFQRYVTFLCQQHLSHHLSIVHIWRSQGIAGTITDGPKWRAQWALRWRLQVSATVTWAWRTTEPVRLYRGIRMWLGCSSKKIGCWKWNLRRANCDASLSRRKTGHFAKRVCQS